ncbi:MAG TPA: hypothetical protein VEI82_04675, partial [Myxococcota bacterium]|nr:hypothetical protein [Myxococcota bacterium]
GSSFLLSRSGGPLARTFSLAHELVRDALYARLSAPRRRELHAACAKQLAERGGAEPAELARHLRAAGDARAASARHREAGERALARHALREAEAHFEAALALADEVGESQSEATLELLLALGQVLLATLGDASPRRRQVYERAYRLARSSPDPRHRFEAAYGLRSCHVMRGELRTAATFEPELLAAIAESGDHQLAARGHGQIGERLFYSGEYEAAAQELERACAFAEQEALDPASRVGVSVVAQGTLAQVECALGRPDTALERMRRMLDALGERPNPYLLGLATWYLAVIHLERRELADSRAQCESLQALASEHGFDDLASWSESLIGYIETASGDVARGLAKLERGMAAMEVTGTVIGRCSALLGLAEARGRLGERETAFALLDQAAKLMPRTGELRMSPAIDLTRAGLLLADLPASRDEIHACLRRGLELATAQHGVQWQIRALTGIVQLDAVAGGGDPGARAQLAAILSDLREGLDLLDTGFARQALASALRT